MIESCVPSKLCCVNLEMRLNSSLVPAYQITNKQKLFMDKLRKVFSIYLEVAVFLQRHQCETIEGMFKI